MSCADSCATQTRTRDAPAGARRRRAARARRRAPPRCRRRPAAPPTRTVPACGRPCTSLAALVWLWPGTRLQQALTSVQFPSCMQAQASIFRLPQAEDCQRRPMSQLEAHLSAGSWAMHMHVCSLYSTRPLFVRRVLWPPARWQMKQKRHPPCSLRCALRGTPRRHADSGHGSTS